MGAGQTLGARAAFASFSVPSIEPKAAGAGGRAKFRIATYNVLSSHLVGAGRARARPRPERGGD